MSTPYRRPAVLLRRVLPLLLIGACESGGGVGPQDYVPLQCGQGNGGAASGGIGPEGGTVTVRGHSLILPAGAVNARTEFSVTETRAGYIGVEVLPHNTRFLKDATLVLSYGRCGGNPAGFRDLRILEVESNTVRGIRVMPSQVDSATRTVRTTRLNHLSGYLIAGT